MRIICVIMVGALVGTAGMDAIMSTALPEAQILATLAIAVAIMGFGK